jgi:hypothetical protein
MATLTTTVELMPFAVPDGVIVKQPPRNRGDGFSPLPKMNLNQLDYATLDALCREWRAEVFSRAGVTDSAPSATRSAYVNNFSQWDDGAIEPR